MDWLFTSRYWRFYTLFKWHFIGWKGRKCKVCTFHEAAHFDPRLEFDMEGYPCGRFVIGKEKS